MRKQNHDPVPVHTDQDVLFWNFVIPSDVETCDEQANEMVSRCESLVKSFEDFIVPTEITYHIHRYPPGRVLPVRLSDDDHIESIKRTLRDESGISIAAFRDSTSVSGPESRWIPRIGIDGTKVKVKTHEGEIFATRNDHTVEYRAGEPTDGKPSRDPIELSLLHGPNNRYDSIDATYVTTVTVSPMSDIWFKETAIGAENRQYLSSFLARIEAMLPVAVVERTSEWLPISDLEAVY